MWENSRCSILFHLEVPGGMWQTVMARPVSSARRASSVFHSRSRYPLEPPGVGADQQLRGVRIGRSACCRRPGPDGRDGELGGVAVTADGDPSVVGADVIHPVGDGLAQVLVREVMGIDPLGIPGWPPGAALAGIGADQLFLLGVHADHRLARSQVRGHLGADVLELPHRKRLDATAPSIIN